MRLGNERRSSERESSSADWRLFGCGVPGLDTWAYQTGSLRWCLQRDGLGGVEGGRASGVRGGFPRCSRPVRG